MVGFLSSTNEHQQCETTHVRLSVCAGMCSCRCKLVWGGASVHSHVSADVCGADVRLCEYDNVHSHMYVCRCVFACMRAGVL